MKDVATAAWVTDSAYYQPREGYNRLAAVWSDSVAVTGAREYDIEVSAFWFTPDTVVATATKRVRILHINEVASPYGAGWTIPGVQRLYSAGSAGVMITNGDGTAVLFSGTGLVAPRGEFSTLTYEAANSRYVRQYRDSTRVLLRASDGQMTRVTDRFGVATAFGYNGAGLLTTITDPAGKVTTITYSSGRLVSMTDPAGRVTNFYFNEDGSSASNLTRIRDPDGVDALSMNYTTSHRLRLRTFRAGGSARYRYDPADRLYMDSLPVVQLEGEAFPRRPVVQFRSLESEQLGGTRGSPAAAISPDTAGARFFNARGNVSRVRYDRYFQPVYIRGPLASDSTSIFRNTNGLPEQTTLPTGAYILYQWDGPRLLSQQTVEANQTYTAEYGDLGLPESQLNGQLRVTSRFGDHGELLRTWVGYDSTQATVFTYDAADGYRLKTVTDAGGHQVTYNYEGTGSRNLSSIVTLRPDSTTLTQSWTYDRVGRDSVVTDPSGTARLFYDVLNRQTLVVGPANDSTRFAYREADSVQTVTDAEGKVFLYRLNQLGWVTADSLATGPARTYAYDANGNLARRVNRDGDSLFFRYDTSDRLSFQRRSKTDSTVFFYGPFTNPWRAAHTYDSTTVIRLVTQDTLRYDATGRLTHEATVIGGVRWARTSYLRPEGPRDSLKYTTPTGTRTIRFRYDAQGRLLRLTGPAGLSDTTHLTYNDESLLTQIGLPTGQSQSFTYTPTHQPLTQTWGNFAVNNAFGRVWDYDGFGRVIEREVVKDRRRVYGYDTAGRLSSFTDSTYYDRQVCSDPNDPLTCVRETGWEFAQDTSYTYDRVGNRTDSDARLYANSNRYRHFGADTLSYDLDGNLVSRSGPGIDQQLFWNALGQLDSVATNGTKVRYTYNGFGQRVQRVEGGATTISIYDGDDLLLEADGSNTVLREYLHYPGIDLPHSVRSGGTTYFYAMEQPGHVIGLASGTSTVAKRYRYTPWGEVEQDSGSLNQPLRFMAREYDAGTGMYYLRARWYSPQLARFLSEDPLGMEAGYHLYAYVGNEPLGHIDPSGLTVCIPDGGAGYTKDELRKLLLTAFNLEKIRFSSSGCILDFTAAEGSNYYFRSLQGALWQMVNSPIQFTIVSAGGPSHLDPPRSSGAFTAFLGTIDINVLTYPTPEAGQCLRSAAGPIYSPESALIHELVGHGFQAARNPRRSLFRWRGEPYLHDGTTPDLAVAWENVYHAAVGEPIRCRY